MDDLVILAVAAVGLGCIFGSFLNALSFRFNTGRTMGGRSRCMHCGHTLGALDLVPVLSYLALGGRCRYCEGRISPQYPLVEVVAGALSFGAYLAAQNPLQYLFLLLVWLTILFIVVYDLRHSIIPWSASLLLAALSFVALFFSGFVAPFALPTLVALAAGPLTALPLFLLSLVSRGRWMGWGDSVFELSLGWLLGVSSGFSALMLAVWSGAGVGILLLLYAQLPWSRRGKGFTMRSEIPFAPFLALGAALAYFLHVDFFSTLPLLW